MTLQYACGTPLSHPFSAASTYVYAIASTLPAVLSPSASRQTHSPRGGGCWLQRRLDHYPLSFPLPFSLLSLSLFLFFLHLSLFIRAYIYIYIYIFIYIYIYISVSLQPFRRFFPSLHPSVSFPLSAASRQSWFSVPAPTVQRKPKTAAAAAWDRARCDYTHSALCPAGYWNSRVRASSPATADRAFSLLFLSLKCLVPVSPPLSHPRLVVSLSLYLFFLIPFSRYFHILRSLDRRRASTIYFLFRLLLFQVVARRTQEEFLRFVENGLAEINGEL